MFVQKKRDVKKLHKAEEKDPHFFIRRKQQKTITEDGKDSRHGNAVTCGRKQA